MGNHHPLESKTEDIPVRGMLNDEYWSTFTFNSDDYELGQVIGGSQDVQYGNRTKNLLQGFGASSTVYSALFTPPNTQSPTSPSASSTPADFYHSDSNPTLQSRHTLPAPGTSRKPHLNITLPAPSSLTTALVSGAFEQGTSSHSQGDRPCAIKVSSSHPDVEQLFKEIRLLALCKHPNVLRQVFINLRIHSRS